jgi:hypothetical protein
VLEFSWGGRTRIDGDGLAFPDVPPGHATAAHFGSLAGRVRAEHLQRGVIDHALFIVINCDNGGFVYPARASGRACHDLGLSDVDAPPMGSLLHLDMSASEIDRLGIPSWKKTILRAMGEYGMYFGDTGTEGYFTIETESGNQYQSLGFSDPWWALATGNDWERFDPTPALPASGDEDRVGKLYDNRRDTAEGIDRDINWERDVWSRLRVLDPCVARGDCTAEPASAASPEPSATAGASIPDPGAAPALRPFDAASGWADPAHGGLRVRPAAGAPAEARSSTGAGLSF